MIVIEQWVQINTESLLTLSNTGQIVPCDGVGICSLVEGKLTKGDDMNCPGSVIHLFNYIESFYPPCNVYYTDQRQF